MFQCNPMVLGVIVGVILIFAATAYCKSTSANTLIKTGSGSFKFVDRQHRTIRVYYFKPKSTNSSTPILFVMHGVHRDAPRYRDQWQKYAEKYRVILLAPEFSNFNFPGKAYNYDKLHLRDNRPNPKNHWLANSIEEIFDLVKQKTKNQSSKYYIYGHSAGAQFVHRMVIFMPQARIKRAIAANAGVYAMPNHNEKYPYGLSGANVSNDQLKKAFNTELIVLLGDKDTDQKDPNLNRSTVAMKQGKYRFMRGHTFFTAAQKSAAQLKTPLKWHLKVVHGAAHSNSQMAGEAARLFFSK